VRIAGNYTFEATREEVWSAIIDPEVLARTIPGCQRLDQVGENEYETTLKVGLQAVRGIYNGRVKIDNMVAPESYELHVDGKGSNGFLKGAGGIKLRAEGDNTILDYGGEAQIGGTIASVGQRLIDGASKTLINQSLKALAAQIEARRNGGAAAGGPTTPEPLARSAAPTDPTTSPTPTNPSAPAEPEAPISPPLISKATPPDAPTVRESSAEAPRLAVAGGPEGPTTPTNPAGPAEPEQPLTPPLISAVTPPEPASGFERRTIVVPAHEQLSEADVARGVVEDFLKENPWAPWVILAFLIGYILGRRK
jgi:carbon monoxide dehydrogenase subunit G